jgi:hypothetical protein
LRLACLAGHPVLWFGVYGLAVSGRPPIGEVGPRRHDATLASWSIEQLAKTAEVQTTELRAEVAAFATRSTA